MMFSCMSICAATIHTDARFLLTKLPRTFTEPRNCNNLLVSDHFTGICSKNYANNTKARYGAAAGSDDRKAQPEFMSPVPEHVGVIMEGNRRWAEEKGLPVEDGIRAGTAKLVDMARFLHAEGVGVLTVFALSAEEEVEFLTSLFEDHTADKHQVRISVTGDVSKLSKSLRKQIEMAAEIHKKFEKPLLHLIIALNSFDERPDLEEAAVAFATKVGTGNISLTDIDSFEKELQMKSGDFPRPDLVVKTRGEKRSAKNYTVLWQIGDTDFRYVRKLFPDLEEEDLKEALISYQYRKRSRHIKS